MLILDLVEGRVLERQGAGGGERIACQWRGSRSSCQDGLRKGDAKRGGNKQQVRTGHVGFFH